MADTDYTFSQLLQFVKSQTQEIDLAENQTEATDKKNFAIPSPQDGNYDGSSSGQHFSPYDVSQFTSEYPKDSGKLLINIANGNNRIAAVSSPNGVKIVNWAVQRQGVPPVLPATEETSTLQLLETRISVWSDDLMADGITKSFARAGSYVYAYTTPPTQSVDSLSVPNSPAVAIESAEVSPADFKTGLASDDDTVADSSPNI